MTLGKKIRLIRGDKTIARFVEGYGICPNTLINYEADRRTPDAAFLTKFCAQEEVDPSWLLGLQDTGGLRIPYQREVLEMVAVEAIKLDVVPLGVKFGKLLTLAYERAAITPAGSRQVDTIVRDLRAFLDDPEERNPYERNSNQGCGATG